MYRARANSYLSRPDRERNDAEQALALAPGNIEAHARLAEGLQGMGRYDQARAETKFILERAPNNLLAHNINGMIAAELGEWDKAEVAANTLSGLGAENWGGFLTARVQMYRGKYNEAVSNFKRYGSRDNLANEWVASSALMAGEGAVAAGEAGDMLKHFGDFYPRANWWLIYAYLGARLDGDSQQAESILEQIRHKADHCEWPYPVLRVFTGEIPYDVAIAKSEEVAFDVLKKIQYWPQTAYGHEVAARAYLGMFAELEGDFDVAKTQYQWVIDHPDQLSLDYIPMVKKRLQGIGGRKSTRNIPSSADPRPTETSNLNDGLLAWLPFRK